MQSPIAGAASQLAEEATNASTASRYGWLSYGGWEVAGTASVVVGAGEVVVGADEVVVGADVVDALDAMAVVVGTVDVSGAGSGTVVTPVDMPSVVVEGTVVLVGAIVVTADSVVEVTATELTGGASVVDGEPAVVAGAAEVVVTAVPVGVPVPEASEPPAQAVSKTTRKPSPNSGIARLMRRR